jgi:tetratricopeptide (TPR) repeat protein
MGSTSTNLSFLLLTCPICEQESLREEAPLGAMHRCLFCREKFELTPQSARPFTVSDDAPATLRRHRDILIHEAGHLAKKGSYLKAVDILRPLLMLDNSRPDVWFALGYCHYKLRDFEKAQAMLTTAYELGSPNAERVLERLAKRIESQAASEPTPESIKEDTPVPGQCSCGVMLHPDGRFCHMCGEPVSRTDLTADPAEDG